MLAILYRYNIYSLIAVTGIFLSAPVLYSGLTPAFPENRKIPRSRSPLENIPFTQSSPPNPENPLSFIPIPSGIHRLPRGSTVCRDGGVRPPGLAGSFSVCSGCVRLARRRHAYIHSYFPVPLWRIWVWRVRLHSGGGRRDGEPLRRRPRRRGLEPLHRVAGLRGCCFGFNLLGF